MDERAKLIYFTLLFFLVIYPFNFFVVDGSGEMVHTFYKLITLYMFITLLWAVYLLRWIRTKNSIENNLTTAEKSIGLFLIILILSTMFSVDLTTAVVGTFHRFEGVLSLFSYLSLFFFTFRFIQNKNHIKILYIIGFLSLLTSLYGVYQYYTPHIFKQNLTRTESFFDNPNFYGAYLVLMLLVTSTLYLLNNTLKINTILLLVNSILFLSLLYTQTRSGWLGIGFGLIFITLFIVKNKKYLWKRWTVLLLSFLIIFAFVNLSENNAYLSRFLSIWTDSSQILSDEEDKGHSGSGRWYIWSESLPLVKDYFWLGSGPDTFGIVYPKDTVFKGLTVDKAHNEYLQIAVTLGVPALLVYFFFISHVLLTGLKAALRTEGESQILLFGLLAICIGYLTQAFFNISVITVAPFFWVILGILYHRSVTFLAAVPLATITSNKNFSV